jgi:hypothetical protein
MKKFALLLALVSAPAFASEAVLCNPCGGVVSYSTVTGTWITQQPKPYIEPSFRQEPYCPASYPHLQQLANPCGETVMSYRSASLVCHKGECKEVMPGYVSECVKTSKPICLSDEQLDHATK